MQVRRNHNLIECIMNSEDLDRYDINVSELKNPNAQDIIGEKLQEILEDINDELGEDEKMAFEGPINIEMLIGNNESILLRIHIPQIQEENESIPDFKKKGKTFDKDERKDLVFSFKTLDDCILFAKQINNLSNFLIEKGKNMTEEDLVKRTEDDLPIPDYVPEEMMESFKKLRQNVVNRINEVIEQAYDEAKKFDGLKTSLYKMNDLYYFICKNFSYNEMNGVPEEFYLNDIAEEPCSAYVEEHGESIIKEKAAESLASI